MASKGHHDDLLTVFLTSPVVLRCSELFDMVFITLVQIEIDAIPTIFLYIDVSRIDIVLEVIHETWTST